MDYKFKDERIRFCLETYEKSTMGKLFLQNVFDGLPGEIYTAIDNYTNKTIKLGKSKVNLTFNKSGWADMFDSFSLHVQKGENIYSIKVFYTYFSSDLATGEDTNKTILFAEKKVQKGIFSSPKREFSQYASINKECNRYTISFIDDVRSSISRGTTSVATDSANQLKKLKTQKEYTVIDKNIYKQVKGLSR